MKTSVIRYRVADFLKQHPPFNEISEEELLALAASGRVIFHESEEHIFRKGQPCGNVIWVIQQGTVAVLDESKDGQQLRDLLGEGDILGSEKLLGNTLYRYTARTTSDVILYSIDAEQFSKVAAANTNVTRFIVAHFPVAEGGDEASGLQAALGESADKKGWLDDSGPAKDFLQRHLVFVPSDATIREAATKMLEASSEWIAVVNKHKRPLGIITTRDLRSFVANGLSIDTSVKTLLTSPPTAARGLTAGDYFLLMMKNRCQALAITSDGTANSALQGVVTDADLSLSTGNNPALLLLKTSEAASVTDHRILLLQQQRLLADALTSPAKVDLCAELATEFLRAMIENVIRQAERELSLAEAVVPPLPYCWLLFGRAGRSESIIPFLPEIGVVFLDGPESPDAKIYYSSILKKVAAYFADCGLRAAPGSATASGVPLCQSLSEWKKSFQSRIADPVGHSMHRWRALFDFHPLSGEQNLVMDIHQTIASALQPHGPFISLMANDTLSNLPPLTFFQGLVVELDGAHRETLDIESTALDPITDAARVFALATGGLDVTNTLARLYKVAGSMPDHAAIFNQAAQAFRIAAYHQALAAFKGQGSGILVSPSILGKYDQRLLKTAFDSIQRLLELSSTSFDVLA